MQMEAFLWLFLPVFVAGGSALLSYYVMQARMEVALAKERESLAEARAMISAHKVTLDERVKATEEACKRQALDDFMHDIRVEERSYVRESKSLNASKKTMVMQERIFFRNIPLSNWIEREMLIEDGLETRQLAAESLFTPPALPTTVETPLAIARLLQEVKGASPKPVVPAVAPQVIEPVLLTQHATAFGAQ
jgi:CRISPR/Cas system CSM-associated protein Csm3 (group 7 of RAMP superfamily)